MSCISDRLKATFITGSFENPDMVTVVEPDTSGKLKAKIVTVISNVNMLEYFPVVSTIVGAIRALVSIAFALVALAKVIFCKNRGESCNEFGLCLKNFARGVTAMVPILGNLALLIADTCRKRIFKKSASDAVNQDFTAYADRVNLFVYGRMKHQKSVVDFHSTRQKSNLAREDAVRSIKNLNLIFTGVG